MTRPTAPELTDPLLADDFYASEAVFAHYARLRSEAPVVWHEDPGFWILSRHAEVYEVSVDSDRFCSSRGILPLEIGITYDSPPTMMHTDPPEHTQYRALVSPAFRPSRIRAMEAPIRARARSLFDDLPLGEPVDVVGRLTVPYPLMVISDLLGVPAEDWPRFFEWSEATIPGATDWSEERRAELTDEMHRYFMALIAERRAAPREDLISDLVVSEIDGSALDDDELWMFLNQLLVAGNETTRNLLSGGLVALAEAPEQFDRLRADRSLLPTTVDELLRWTTPVVGFMRTATRSTELAGCAIEAGDPVHMLYASANRDEVVFGDDAEELDVGREPNPHLAFGFGVHFCIGAALARLEASIFLEELLARVVGMELAGPVERTPSGIIAGVRAATLDLTPT